MEVKAQNVPRPIVTVYISSRCAMSLPTLPKIAGDVDIILDIYSHRSLKTNTTINEELAEYGDTDRLIELGRRVLSMVVAVHMFSKRPMILADEFSAFENRALSDDNLKQWLTAYDIQSKFRSPHGEPDIMESPHEMRNFFHAYIGALTIRNGANHVQAWISALIDPDANSFAPPPPTGMPPPLPTSHPSSPPRNSGPSNIVSLALVNQTAAQRAIAVTYPAEQTGPPHTPTWTVQCCMNGIEKGRGVAKSQKGAKEEAAREAFYAMGWGG
ncbi:hypothetical protein B0H10DRAFT_1023651 [Mycena sp. CBHHK59/15]|nr:hypothetical protein B0H10DRAFT_1023651 [Mycena sp. CBHHK59/15]